MVQAALDRCEGQEVGWLVPAHHPGDACADVSGGDEASGVGTGRKGVHYGPDEELIDPVGSGGASVAHSPLMDRKPNA